MSRSDLLVLLLLPAVAIAVAVLFGIVLPRAKRRRRLRGPIAVTMLTTGDDVIPPRPTRPPAPGRAPIVAAPLPTSVPNPQIQVAARTGTDDASAVESKAAAETPHLRLEPSLGETALPRPEGRASSRKPPRVIDGTLQFLPGRLEIIEGRDLGQEIRFVRQPGDDVTTITFGRSDGPPYRHVQLHEPTVSRLHAKMTLEGKLWRVTNLSNTNPIVVNSAPLEGEGSSVVLSEGDRVEMGEVVFRYRAK